MSGKKDNFENLVSDNMLTILIVIFFVAVVFSFVPGIFYYIYFDASIVSDNEIWGQFGDFFGGILNPILGFFALVAILLTIVLQSRELKLTRNEMQQSNQVLQIQKFERTFFEMLRLLGNIVEDIDMLITEEKEAGQEGFSVIREKFSRVDSGRICFKHLREKLQEIYEYRINDRELRPDEYPQVLGLIYHEFATHFEHKIGHYFRTLYRIFKFVHESDPQGTLGIDKKNYAGIARAMLSSNELALLFYDCFYQKGEKFANLIIEYSIFENMEHQKLFDVNNHLPLYNLKAYGDDDEIPHLINQDVPVHFQGR